MVVTRGLRRVEDSLVVDVRFENCALGRPSRLGQRARLVAEVQIPGPAHHSRVRAQWTRAPKGVEPSSDVVRGVGVGGGGGGGGVKVLLKRRSTATIN